jgi:carboxypeptidase Taq
MPTTPAYDQVTAHLRSVGHLGSISALVSWDQETYMPPAAAPMRAEQSSLLAEVIHQRLTDTRVGEWLAACEADANLMKKGSATAANLREMRRDYDRRTKLPSTLVAELADTSSRAQHVWKDARAKSDFKMFAPWLDKMMALHRRKAECYGVPAGGEFYDALIDEYEPGVTAREIAAVFGPLRSELTTLVKQVAGAKKKINTSCLTLKIDTAAQHAFGQKVLEAMGFDLQAGRLDVTTHPFCSGFGAGDTRLTTRYRDEKFTDALFGTMHEGGHGLYEQGLPKADVGKKKGVFGQPISEAVSLGIHESQSRMWENFVGRSCEFWTWALPLAAKTMSPKFKSVSVDQMYAAVNTTTPSLIRVEADEGTYNMHVMIRFEIERALLSGDMKVKDVPSAWNERYADFLGVKVPDDRRGCLQDVHWSFGLVGYFPTYTLGNLYAAQFWEKILNDMPSLPKDMTKGRLLDLRDWLNDKIHRHGRRYTATELCRKVTGKSLSAEPLLRHLRRKAAAVYGIPE